MLLIAWLVHFLCGLSAGCTRIAESRQPLRLVSRAQSDVSLYLNDVSSTAHQVSRIRHPLVRHHWRSPDHLSSQLLTQGRRRITSHQEPNWNFQFRQCIPPFRQARGLGENSSLGPRRCGERDSLVAGNEMMCFPNLEYFIVPTLEEWGGADREGFRHCLPCGTTTHCYDWSPESGVPLFMF